MLNINPPDYRYCPFCGQRLGSKQEEDRVRKECRECKWTYYPHVGASVMAVIHQDSDVLLVQRKRDPFTGTWMFPSGFPNFGEHPAETLKREVREETGLDVTAYNLVNVFQSEDDPRLLGHFVFLYDVAVGGGKPTTDQEENEAIGWFSTMRPPLVAWKLHRMALEALQRDGSLNSLRNV